MRRSGVLIAVIAAVVVALALPAAASAQATPFTAGASVIDITPPPFNAGTDAAYFSDSSNGSIPAVNTACSRALFNGPRLWKFQEPYQDTNADGRFDYDVSGGGGAAPIPEPYCDINGNGRWDGIYSSGGVDKQELSVHDPIQARAVAIGDGQHTVGIVSVVAQGLHGNYLNTARDLATGASDAQHPDRRAYDNIVISANHNESSPDTVGIYGGPDLGIGASANSGIDDYYYDFLEKQIAKATAQAYDAMEPASLGETEFNMPSNLEQELSKNFPTTNDDGSAAAVDPKVRLLQATDSGGDPLFTIANIADHNQEIGHGPHVQDISSDWPGYFERKLDQDLGTGTGMFLVADNGSIEDLKTNPRNPSPECDGCYEQAQATGETLANVVESHLSSTTDLRPGTVSAQRQVFDVPLENNLFRVAAVAGLFGQRQLYTGGQPTGRAGTDLRTSVAVVTVGPDLQFLANPGEAFPGLMLGSPWGIDDPDGLNEDVGCPNRPNPSVPSWHASATHRFQIGLADDMIGYEIPAWAYTEIPGAFTNQPPNLDTCTNDANTGLDPAGHKHKLETEGVGPSASNAVADHLTTLLSQTPDPTAKVVLGRFIHAPDADHPDVWLSRRAHDTRFSSPSDAIGIWFADDGSATLAGNSGTIVTTDGVSSIGSRPADAHGSFMDFDGVPEVSPDISTRGMVVPATGTVEHHYYVDVYPGINQTQSGDGGSESVGGGGSAGGGGSNGAAGAPGTTGQPQAGARKRCKKHRRHHHRRKRCHRKHKRR